ncbi:MAG: spermidine synthase, partial [Blastocatellia bacterium]
MGVLYAITILLNALLLFLVQPMIAKMLLPYLGGTPSVWNTCMLFFQAMLLGGYAYAHFTTKWLGPKRQLALHLALLSGAALVFPVAISESALKSLDNGAQPVAWLLGQLLMTVGLPFFMLSTGGPLLQQWFSRTDHPTAKDPYFLYGASNLGSLAALLGYPLLIEPALRLRRQSLVWAGGYLVLIAAIGGCAAIRWRFAGRERAGEGGEHAEAAEALTAGRRLRWVALAFAPSSLMLGVTTFLSTDISPIPLLWVVPLALYLVTFILAFAKRQWLSMRWTSGILPIFALLMCYPIMLEIHRPVWSMAPLHLLLFFLIAMTCHRQLAEDRPHTRYLTEFYLWLSVGGVLGGIFNSLIAPNLFRSVIEYPIAIVIALMLRPNPRKAASAMRDRALDLALPAGLALSLMAMVRFLPKLGVNEGRVTLLAIGLSLAIGILSIKRPVRFALYIGAILWACGPLLGGYGNTLHIERNFFGVLRVSEDRSGLFRQIYHGNTLHGRQYLDAARQCEPLSYYHREGPLGQVFAAFGDTPASPNVAVIGLGTGATACYAGPEQHWTFYEIDPAVVRIAKDPAWFTYLSKCAANPVETVLGDARLQLRHAPEKHYGLIVLDAFSSDAIPTHLLTREAFDLYLSKLADGGRIALHASNQYLDLRPAIGDLALSAG